MEPPTWNGAATGGYGARPNMTGPEFAAYVAKQKQAAWARGASRPGARGRTPTWIDAVFGRSRGGSAIPNEGPQYNPDLPGGTSSGGGGNPWMPSWMPDDHESGDWQDWYTNNPYATGTAVTPPPGADPSLFDQGAFDAMMLLLEQYGLGSLAGVLQDLILDGITDQASLMLALQQTQEWKDRFAGNEMLAQQGLPMLSVGEYLAVERSYAQILKNYGLPEGFYDDPSDFAKWIGNSVSANELNQRATMYSDLAKREDPAVVEQLRSMGLSEGDILAHLMDPSRAMPLLQKKYQTTLIGAAARRQGLVGDNEYLGHLADLGVTEERAIQGYGVIGENLGDMGRLGDIYDEDYTQRDFESEVFEQSGTSAKKRKRLASRERATFSGSSGVGRGSLTGDTSGSY